MGFNMKHHFARVKEVKVLRNYVLRLRFSDLKESEIDFEPVLRGELYSPLKDKALFDQVTIDDEVGTISWPNGADYDPSMLYSWNQVAREFCDQMNSLGDTVANQGIDTNVQ